MKYVNHYTRIFSCVIAALALLACGSQQVKTGDSKEAKKSELLASLEYLPVPIKAEDGKFLAYEPEANPYVTRGRIKKSSVVAFIEARKAFKAKDLETAQKLFVALTEVDNSLSGPWVMLGDIALESNDRDTAKAHYEKALTINKDNMNAWLRLAYVQRLQGEYHTAQNTYVSALQVWKDCPEAHLNLAILYDLYLNLPIRAQRHMEAYLFLNKEPDTKVVTWLNDLQARTGLAVALPLKDGMVDPGLVVSK